MKVKGKTKPSKTSNKTNYMNQVNKIYKTIIKVKISKQDKVVTINGIGHEYGVSN